MSLVDIVPFVLIFGVMYFLILKPQIDEKRAHDQLVASLAKDDRVVTGAGIHGRIVSVAEETLVLEIDSKTRITLEKTAVSRRLGDT